LKISFVLSRKYLKSLKVNCKFTIVPGPVPAKRTAVRPEGGSIVDSPADVVVIEDVAVVMEVVSPPGVEAVGLEVGPEGLEEESEELDDEAVVVEDDGEVGPEPSQSARDG
jgi:hypothetical protein